MKRAPRCGVQIVLCPYTVMLIKLGSFQQDLRSGKWSNGAEMTEEEALAEQQRMFAEARARMNGGTAAPKQPEPDQSLEN